MYSMRPSVSVDCITLCCMEHNSISKLQAQAAAHQSWGNTTDRTARTAPARRAFEERWLRLGGGDPLRARALRKAHFANMALRSAKARKRRGPAGRTDESGPR